MNFIPNLTHLQLSLCSAQVGYLQADRSHQAAGIHRWITAWFRLQNSALVIIYALVVHWNSKTNRLINPPKL